MERGEGRREGKAGERGKEEGERTRMDFMFSKRRRKEERETGGGATPFQSP